MPRFKPLLRWEPFPYLVVFVLLLATGFIRPDAPAWVLWPFLVLLIAAIAYLVVGFVRDRRPGNPDRWGDLATLDGLAIVDAPSADRDVRAVVPVDDAHRHQSSIELARVRGGVTQEAVLVPRASRWMSPRYRVGVQLVGGVADGDRPRHAGFLRQDAQDRWAAALDERRQRGEYVRVPAFITRAERPFGVELDLSGVDALG
ncbi:hypothetical protein GE115_16065 [Agromyces sp. CFH 90414]|uniref:Uncharacterized protein n=1 Tax=Agromyces agglutinans TaxID=2662258 RepID=A0A6I2FHF0_9MICO|nr:hypothetical protein [Agromyces agglutinans]MRG61373.1 hypothetical protein [Agromyces agglutinans]